MQDVTRPSGLPANIPWRSYSGKIFNLLAPDPNLITIDDIAHHLARTCRWSGGVPGHYSVAEHSLRIGLLVPERLRVAARLHDAHEMPLGDCISPLKELLPTYRWIAQQWDIAICQAFDVALDDLHSEVVQAADHLMRALERTHLLGVGVVRPSTDAQEWDVGTHKWGLYRSHDSSTELFGIPFVARAYGQQVVDDLLRAADLRAKQ
jgi:hypothetical protein